MLLALAASLVGGYAAAGRTLSAEAATVTFTGTELLSRPTSTSVAVTIVPDSAITLRYQYGTAPGSYTGQTASTTATAGTPKTVVISGLSANTKYYYRLQYSTDGGLNWTDRPEHSFQTARDPGSTFKFDITSDSHVNIVMGSATTWTNTCNGVAADNPDFLIDLGDTVAIRGLDPGDVAEANEAYEYQLQFFNLVSASAPVFLVPGNHEQKEGWHVEGDAGDPEDSLPVIGTNAQKKYFPMPVPDGFYTGDSSTLSYLDGDKLRENYYAWTWGDALFVVIDPFWYTTTKPYVSDLGGGEAAGGSGDSWDWTLGKTQFDWLKTTLTSSTAKYKFIFTHQLLSDASLTGQEDYGHAGANHAHLVEWGGYNEDGTTYAWDTKRPGWGSKPIHQILVDTGVSAVFHGHDHQYAYEKRDGVVYQSVPAAGWGDGANGFGMYATGDGYTIQARPNAGHLRVTVGPSQTTVEYIRVGTTTSDYTYTIQPAVQYSLTIAADPADGGTTTPSVGTHVYSSGTVVDVTATAAAGYEFSGWTGDYTGPGPCQVTMNADKSVTAHFQPLVSGAATSAATPSDAAPHVGDQITVDIAIDVSGVAAPDNLLGSFTASLDWDPAVLSYAGDSGLKAGFTGVVNNAGAGTGHIVFNGAKPAGAGGNVVVFTITFDVIAAGTSTLDLAYSAMAAATTFDNLLPILTVNDGSVAATLAPYRLTVAVSPAGAGTTIPAVGDHDYPPGTLVEITATAAPGYEFSGWTGDYTGPGPCQLTMDGDKSVTANFTAVPAVQYTLTLSVSPAGAGTTIPAVGSHAYAAGTVVDISAAAASGYQFSNWSGDVADYGSASTTVTMDGDKSVTANFIQASEAPQTRFFVPHVVG